MRIALPLTLLVGSLTSAYAADVKLVNPPKELKLNDRKHPIEVAYDGVNGEADIHVDLLDGNRWMGGGTQRVTGGAGTAKVPIEVRVSPDFNGQLDMRTYITGPGGNYGGKMAGAPDQYVGISKAPTDAIGVLCQPSQVTPGQGFQLNLWYTQTHARESDVIVVALHADTKQYFGGFTTPINQMRGQVSGWFQLQNGDPSLPLKFKAWISPRGEEAPNYVSYTILEIPLSWNHRNDCPNIGNQGYGSAGQADWIELMNVPGTVGRGSKANIGMEYNLISEPEAELELSLMSWNWQTHEAYQLATVKQTLTQGRQFINMDLPIPQDVQPGRDGVYLIAFFNTPGKGYEGNLAEDRKYKIWLGDWTNQASGGQNYGRPGLRVIAQPGQAEVTPNGGVVGNVVRAGFNWLRNGNMLYTKDETARFYPDMELE